MPKPPSPVKCSRCGAKPAVKHPAHLYAVWCVAGCWMGPWHTSRGLAVAEWNRVHGVAEIEKERESMLRVAEKQGGHPKQRKAKR